MTHSVVNFGCK